MDENKKQKNSPGELKTIRTYMTDMADTVRANEVSVIKVALAEQNKKATEELYKKVEGTPGKKIFWFISGLILIGGAIYGTYFLLKEKAKNNVPKEVVKELTIISYDQTSTIDLNNGDDLSDKIINTVKEKNSSTKNNSIKYLSLTKNINGLKSKIEMKEIFSSLRLTAPSSLVRALNDSYMVGTYSKEATFDASSTTANQELFMIFQIKDYEYSYAGMLDWEKTLAGDMIYLFNFDTKESKLQPEGKHWKDIIINNKDARVLLNEENQPILYYIFPDKNNLVITSSVDAIKEILARSNMKR